MSESSVFAANIFGVAIPIVRYVLDPAGTLSCYGYSLYVDKDGKVSGKTDITCISTLHGAATANINTLAMAGIEVITHKLLEEEYDQLKATTKV